MPRISSSNWRRGRIPLETNDISDSGTVTIVILANGSDLVTDSGSQTIVVLGTGSEAIGDAATSTVVLVLTGEHTVEGVAEPPPPPPPPPPAGVMPWIGSSDYAAQMRMEDQHLVDRMEREGW